MFELHRFLPLFEPAWASDPDKTARVIVELIDHAKSMRMDATVSMLEHCLSQLLGGVSLRVIGVEVAPAPESPQQIPAVPLAPLPPEIPKAPSAPGLPALPSAPSVPAAPPSPRGRRQKRA